MWINLKINKESLQNLIEQRVPKEQALINSINVISSENIRLQMQVERLKQDNSDLKNLMVSFTSTPRHPQALPPFHTINECNHDYRRVGTSPATH